MANALGCGACAVFCDEYNKFVPAETSKHVLWIGHLPLSVAQMSGLTKAAASTTLALDLHPHWLDRTSSSRSAKIEHLPERQVHHLACADLTED
jgi:hypothetical protein